MSGLSGNLIRKLNKVAEIVDAEKHLYFFGLVHHDLLPPDRWDVLVSAKGLVPWSTDAIEYLVKLLRRELTDSEMVKIAQVLALPRESQFVAPLAKNGRSAPNGRSVDSSGTVEEALVIWPGNASMQLAKTA